MAGAVGPPAAREPSVSDGAAGFDYVCLVDASYELTFEDSGSTDTDSDEHCAEIVGTNGGSHSGCAGTDSAADDTDDDEDSSFAAIGGVVHNDVPTSAPSAIPVAVPTPSPSPECPAAESLYTVQLTDSGADGWEGIFR